MKVWAKETPTGQPMMYATEGLYLNLFDYLGRKVASVGIIKANGAIKQFDLTEKEVINIMKLMYPN